MIFGTQPPTKLPKATVSRTTPLISQAEHGFTGTWTFTFRRPKKCVGAEIVGVVGRRVRLDIRNALSPAFAAGRAQGLRSVASDAATHANKRAKAP